MDTATAIAIGLGCGKAHANERAAECSEEQCRQLCEAAESFRAMVRSIMSAEE